MLKARGKLISLLTACMALVLMLVMGITTLSIQPKVASAADTTIVFNLGADGSASHNDGSEKSSYSETVGDYTLSLTGGSKMYTGARDAKGNSCIKLGTNSAVGKFSFTVPADVTSVIIAVGKYKTNTTKITVNGTAYTITNASSNGAYDEITVDTTSTKTVSFTTVSGGARAMVNTITFVIPGDCQHTNKKTETKEATCTEAGETKVTCNDCGQVISNTPISALGHDDTENVVQDATCTETGNKTYTCRVCGNVRSETIPVKDHTYENGKCSVCGEKEPTAQDCILTFDEDKANRVSFSTTKQVWSQNGITFTNNKASSTTNVADYGAPVRLYAGSEIIIESLNMSKIIFNCNTTGYATELKNSIGNDATVSGKVVTVKFNELTNEFTVAKLTAQVRLDSITVTMEIIVDDGCQHANMQYVEAKASTCFQKGNIAYYYCEDCKTYYNENEEIIFQVETEIPLDKHTEVTIPAQEKTCTTDGSTEGVKCSVCDTVITAPTTIPAGHTYLDGVCSMCGAEQPAEATLTFDNAEKRTEFSITKQVWVENGIILTNNKTADSTNVADYVNPARFYKNSELIVEYDGMIKIVFNCNRDDDATALKNSIGDRDTATVTVEEKVVTVVFDEVVNSFAVILSADQVRMDSITVYAEKQEAGNEGVGVEIDSASVTLGEDVALNYYVTMADGLNNVTMNFTMNGEVYDRTLAQQTDGRYKVSLELPPQYMANEITVELIYNDAVIETMVYSVKQYAEDMLGKEESSDELKQLLTDMLYYGAAAQNYTGHNTENLATDGVENLLEASTLVPETTDFNLVNNETGGEYPAYFKGAGVRFDAVNSIYVKLSTTENVTLAINDGEPMAVTGTTVYTEGIKATQFADTYTFKLYHNGVLMQTLTYSVNAYAHAKKDSATMGELALALYRYGQSAVAYKNAGK